MEKAGIIQITLFPYVSPIIAVLRKCPPGSPVQEEKRLSVDYRKVNAQLPTVLGDKSLGVITLDDIPKIDEMLACLHGSRFFTHLDFRSRYYLIKLSLETRHKTQ